MSDTVGSTFKHRLRGYKQCPKCDKISLRLDGYCVSCGYWEGTPP